jgi:hypothetical protein
MPLARLHIDSIGHVNGIDLAPLHELVELRELKCGTWHVSDLRPLKGLKLEKLSLFGSQVADLGPLEGMPLAWLDCRSCGRLSELAPLKRVPLETFFCEERLTRSQADVLRQMPTLKWINDQKASTVLK